MKTGTKSLLFGAHQFIIHPIFVAISWIKLYGWTWKIQHWVAFWVHDLGYWGKSNMDGNEGKTHPELGAKIMHYLFDRYEYETFRYDNATYYDYFNNIRELRKLEGWKVCDIQEYDDCVSVMYKRKTKQWYNFTLLHSRHYATEMDILPSKLCYADKMAFVITPRWLYIPMAKATGEIYEYMKDSENTGITYAQIFCGQWHHDATKFTREWVEKNNI